MTKKDHRGIGTGLQYVPKNWNNEWNSWLLSNPNFTQKQASEKAQSMLREAGCKGEFKFFNYNTKQLSKVSIAGSRGFFICSKNAFLKFCSKLGYLLLKIFRGSKIGGQILAILTAIRSFVFVFFGIKVEQPVAVGVGIVCFILGISTCIGIIILKKSI